MLAAGLEHFVPEFGSIWAAIPWEMCRGSFWGVALCAPLMPVAPKRPSEPLKLLERGGASETYATDESIDLSCRWASCTSTLAAALRQGNPRDPTFNCTFAAYLKRFLIARERLGIKAAPYQVRYSSASIDAALEHRARPEIKAHGRWKADMSVLRRDSKAKNVESVDELRESMSTHAKTCECRLEDLWRGRIELSVIAPPVAPKS
ncbi:unnamed protein product, partial [Prorocentrum cordatum]